MVMLVHVFAREMVHDVDGLGGRQQRDDAAVAEEPQVAEVGHDVNWGAPGECVGAVRTSAGVVYRGDVAAAEADSWTQPEELPPGVCV